MPVNRGAIRSPVEEEKEEIMRIRTLAVGTGLVVALAAATAGTSTAHMTAPRKTTHPATHKVYTAPFGNVAIRSGNYIYLPGFAPNPNAQPAAGGCTWDGNNCTTEELCLMWGEC
jgi:hypothetical protein